MNKRMDAIRSAINSHQSDVLSGDNKPAPLPRVSSGSVRSMKESFSDVERENSELRERLNSVAAVQEVDPDLIDPSPIADRFNDTEDADFKALKASIQERGQEVPVLLRVHPNDPGRYQSAYGHRRIRAARELGLSVKAVIRPLTDQDLVLAQGIENSARQDLSFIERAVFAARLKDEGYESSVVQSALSIDRAEASKLLAVARAIPPDIIEAIGKAPKAGRPRWLALAEILKTSKPAVKAVRTAINSPDFSSRPSDKRFVKVFNAATVAPGDKETAKAGPQAVLSHSGKKIAQVRQSGQDLKISLDQGLDAAFASFLVERLPDLFASFEGMSGRDEPGEA
jgi:ParB family chromosome partitioning protein